MSEPTRSARLSRRQFVAGAAVVGIAAGPFTRAHAQEPAASGGRTWVVDQQRPNASDSGPGTQTRPFRTISEAALRAQPADTVVVHAGIYRERVAPRNGGTADAPITYAAADGEQVTIKGSDVWRPAWQAIPGHDGVFFGAFTKNQFAVDRRQAGDWGSKFPSQYKPYAMPMRVPPGGFDFVLGQLFVDGSPLIQVGTAELLHGRSGSWMVAPGTADGLYVNFGMSRTAIDNHLVELTVRPRCFAPYKRGLAYITVRGFQMEHGATNFPTQFWTTAGYPQAGILGTRSGHHWTIEHNVVRHANTIGIDIGREGANDADGLGQAQPQPPDKVENIVRNNIVSDNGSNGVVGYVPTYSEIRNNRIERNNTLGFTAPEVGGVKVHTMTGGIIAGNLIRDNSCVGIWLDQTYTNVRVTRNTLVSNQSEGIMIELGAGPALVDNNVIALTRPGPVNGGGDGCYAQDAAGVTFAHNLLFQNAGHGLWFHCLTDRTDAEGHPVSASNWNVDNNLVYLNCQGAFSFPIESERSTNNHGDHNVFTPNRQSWMTPTPVPVFTVNPNAGPHAVPVDDLVNLYKQNLDDHGVSADMRPGLERWRDIRYLLLDEWQWMTAADAHSLPVDPAVANNSTLAGEALILELTADDSPRTVGAAKLADVDVDYFGSTIPEQPLAGPFQHLTLGGEPNYIILVTPAAGPVT